MFCVICYVFQVLCIYEMITGKSTFKLIAVYCGKFKTHYVAPQFSIFQRTVQIAPNFLHWNAHIFLFWLNHTGHSKFHNTSKNPPPATDPSKTACHPLYPPVQVVPPLLPPPLFFHSSGQRNRWRPVPLPVTDVRYNSLLLMCTLNTLTWPDLTEVNSTFIT